MFNIRVYGILINDQDEILVSDELIKNQYITKFCGGGLELGEGTIDCLKREYLEEMNLRIEVLEHLYTTDFFQPSAFNAIHQIISIYYLVKPLEPISIKISEKRFDFNEEDLKKYARTQQIESFRFINMHQFSEMDVTLPIDKIVAKKIKEIFANSEFSKNKS